MSTRDRLTPASIDALRRGHLKDAQTPGLSIAVTPTGHKVWVYRRRVSRSGEIFCQRFRHFPRASIAEARAWAAELNAKVELGINPRTEAEREQTYQAMTVAKAHGLDMEAVAEGRSSRAKRKNKPRTVEEKREIYERDIAPMLGGRIIYDVSEKDLILLVEAKGKVARMRANRLAAELRVFFGWAASGRHMHHGPSECSPLTWACVGV